MHKVAPTLVLLVLVASAVPATAPQELADSSRIFGFPLTSNSPAALKSLAEGQLQFENLQLTQAINSMRAAVKADPNFAMAHLLIGRISYDPSERLREYVQAGALAANASKDEQLYIEWHVAAEEGRFVSAITAMNELLGKYPRNKRLLYAAALFYGNQKAYDRALDACNRALALDPEYATALNQLGYEYAYTRQVEKAIPVMEHYAALLPKEPNPEDSYAEILRMNGRFDAALVHYRKALALDATFDSSQAGIADTLQLMGRQAEARPEYDKAIPMVPDEATKIIYLQRQAITWVREKNYAAADKAHLAIAERARMDHMPSVEADTLRAMALYQPDHTKAFALLDRAEKALDSGSVSKATHAATLAPLLRDRVLRAIRARRLADAEHWLQQLQALSDAASREDVLTAYEVADGAMRLARGKTAEGIARLKEAPTDPLALHLLATQATPAEASAAKAQLEAFHEVTIEQAVTR